MIKIKPDLVRSGSSELPILTLPPFQYILERTMFNTELLDVREAARLLHLKESTIRSWILHKRIPHTRIGRRVFIRRSDCEAQIMANLVLPTTQQSPEEVL